MHRKTDKFFRKLGVTTVALRAPSVTPSNTLTIYFIILDTDISKELLILTFLSSYYMTIN